MVVRASAIGRLPQLGVAMSAATIEKTTVHAPRINETLVSETATKKDNLHILRGIDAGQVKH